MFLIKIKVKGYLKNLTENTTELIDTKGIKKSNIISYIINNTKHKLIEEENKLILYRENDEIQQTIIFEKNKINSSEYFLKNLNSSLNFSIETMNIEKNKKRLDITYKILESENIYNYVLEVSDDL